MKLSSLLAKMTYWNAWFDNKKKMISISSLKRKIYNPKYMFIYIYKNEEELKYTLPNVIAIEHHEFVLRINMLNKKQNIILLNNIHESSTIYNELKEKEYNVSILDWGKYKNINDIFKKILKIK